MAIEVEPKIEEQETKKVIKQTRKEIKEVPMGDVLLEVFDKFAEPSIIVIHEDKNHFNKFKNKLVANIKNQNIPISLTIQRRYNVVELNILGLKAESFSKVFDKSDFVSGEYSKFISGEKIEPKGIYYPNVGKNYGISMYSSIDGLELPSQEADIVIEISHTISKKSLEKYPMLLV